MELINNIPVQGVGERTREGRQSVLTIAEYFREELQQDALSVPLSLEWRSLPLVQSGCPKSHGFHRLLYGVV